MTDVVKIAMERRDELRAEVEKLDRFIETAEALMRFTPELGGRPAQAGLPRSSRS